MLFLGICSFLAISCTSDKDGKDFVKCVLKQGILERAAMNIKEEPVTVTAFIAERSAGIYMIFIRRVIIGGQIL